MNVFMGIPCWRRCDDDDEDSDDDDDDDTGDDDDDFVYDDYLHLLHWHKATGQMWKQIILSNVRWILFWEDILQIRIHIKNTNGHRSPMTQKLCFAIIFAKQDFTRFPVMVIILKVTCTV